MCGVASRFSFQIHGDRASPLESGDENFAFHDTDRVSNGRIEGTAKKIGVLERVAYGSANRRNRAAGALILAPSLPARSWLRTSDSSHVSVRYPITR